MGQVYWRPVELALATLSVAEARGFEPLIALRLYLLSKQARSATPARFHTQIILRYGLSFNNLAPHYHRVGGNGEQKRYTDTMTRKIPLVNNENYHVINRSIAGYKVFNRRSDFERFCNIIEFYRRNLPYKYSVFNRLTLGEQQNILKTYASNNMQQVSIVAYCVMPTHIHIILKQQGDRGVSRYVNNILNSYSKYFNIKYKRKGPLWEGRFKSVHIESDEQLLHLTRYIHLNPVSANLVSKPEEWEYSSYREYLGEGRFELCSYRGLMEIEPESYKRFVRERIDYQKELSLIKSLLLDNYTG